MSFDIQGPLQVYHIRILLRIDLGVWEEDRKVIDIELHGHCPIFVSPQHVLVEPKPCQSLEANVVLGLCGVVEWQATVALPTRHVEGGVTSDHSPCIIPIMAAPLATLCKGHRGVRDQARVYIDRVKIWEMQGNARSIQDISASIPAICVWLATEVYVFQHTAHLQR